MQNIHICESINANASINDDILANNSNGARNAIGNANSFCYVLNEHGNLRLTFLKVQGLDFFSTLTVLTCQTIKFQLESNQHSLRNLHNCHNMLIKIRK